jgi:hypothetical protein
MKLVWWVDLAQETSMSESPTGTPPVASVVPSGPRRSFGERLIGALKLDASVYDEVEHDPDALGQAAGVVALAAVAAALGSLPVGGGRALLLTLVSSFVGWLLGTAIIWGIGVKAMGHTSDYPELLRTLGFASAPQILLVLSILPLGPLRIVLSLAVFALTLVAFVVAVRQALDVSTGRAVGVCLLAVLAWALLTLVCGRMAM